MNPVRLPIPPHWQRKWAHYINEFCGVNDIFRFFQGIFSGRLKSRQLVGLSDKPFILKASLLIL
ncbi:hypothetical protein [Cellvibrio sp.]|uniref:hypothetical protein n=1 Tax=Cellvibrio sp. TaxID=1965322 RepID=UPI0039648767